MLLSIIKAEPLILGNSVTERVISPRLFTSKFSIQVMILPKLVQSASMFRNSLLDERFQRKSSIVIFSPPRFAFFLLNQMTISNCNILCLLRRRIKLTISRNSLSPTLPLAIASSQLTHLRVSISLSTAILSSCVVCSYKLKRRSESRTSLLRLNISSR